MPSVGTNVGASTRMRCITSFLVAAAKLNVDECHKLAARTAAPVRQAWSVRLAARAQGSG